MQCACAPRIDMDTRIYMPTSYSSHLNRNQAPIFTSYSIKCHRFQKSAVFHFLHYHVPLMCPPPISAPTPCCAWQSRICHLICPNQSLNIPINQPTPTLTPSLPHHSLNSYSIVPTLSLSTVHGCIFILNRSYCNIHLTLTVITSTH